MSTSRSSRSSRSPRSPASAPAVPPPITSLLLPPKQNTRLAQSQRFLSPQPYPESSNPSSAYLQALFERSRVLERKLQQHLDSQSEALSDPTLSSTLRDARRGILKGMRDLRVTKQAERELLQAQVDARQQKLDKAEILREKIKDLETREQERLESFKSELGTVENEIRKLEDKLSQLKGRRDHLRVGVDGIENGVAARASSYRESLRVLEKEIDSERLRSGRRRRRSSTGEEEQGPESHLERVSKEDDALEKGINLFRDVLSKLSSFESSLSSVLRSTKAPDYNSLRSLFEETEKALEESLGKCEAEGWNLLIAAVGVELEALQHGWDIIKDMIPLPPPADAVIQSEDDEQRSRGEGGGDTASAADPLAASATVLPYQQDRLRPGQSSSQSQTGHALQASSSTTYKTSPSSPQLREPDNTASGFLGRSAMTSHEQKSTDLLGLSRGASGFSATPTTGGDGGVRKTSPNLLQGDVVVEDEEEEEDEFDHVPPDLLGGHVESDDEADDEPDPGLLFVQS